MPDLAGGSAWEQTAARGLPGLMDLAANLPRLKPPAAGATDVTQLKQQLQQHSKGLAQSLIRQMVPKRTAVTSTSSIAAGAAGARAAAARGGPGSGAGRQAGTGSSPAVRDTPAAGRRTGAAMLWRLLQQQEQGAPLQEVYRAAAGALRSSSSSSSVSSTDALQDGRAAAGEEQEEAGEERVGLGGACTALNVPTQQTPRQQQAVMVKEHAVSSKVCADAVVSADCDAAVGAASCLSGADSAAADAGGSQVGVGAGAQPQLCGVVADFSDCQALLAVMAAMLE